MVRQQTAYHSRMKSIYRLAVDRLRKQYLHLQDAAIQRGLLRGQRDYVRFVIVCRSRVGSNMLSSYLNSHPGIVVKDEIFSFRRMQEPGSLAAAQPVEYLEREAFSAYPPKIEAVGFKLFYTHGRQKNAEGVSIWDHLLADRRIKIIHLVRQNILRSHLSEAIAFRTSKWTQSGQINAVKTEDKRETLDFDKCRDDFERTERWQQNANRFFSGHDMLDVSYEDLSADPAPVLSRIQSFLGVQPRNLSSFHSKQNPEQLSELIANYAELKAQFSGTPWQRFFED